MRIFIALAAAAVGAATLIGGSVAASGNDGFTLAGESTKSVTASETTSKPGFPATDPDAPGVPEPYYEVVVALAHNSDDPRLQEAQRSLAEVGYYRTGVETISSAACKDGNKYDEFNLDRGRENYYGVILIFNSAENAQQFVDAYEPGVVGTVKNENCLSYDDGVDDGANS